MNKRKLCVLIDEWSAISNEMTQYFLNRLSCRGPQQRASLLGCLHNNGFDPHYLQAHLLAFACDGDAWEESRSCCAVFFPNSLSL